MNHAQVVTEQTFDEVVLRSALPVLVDFWAEWCGPCKALLPTVSALAEEYAGRVAVVKVNVDECNAIAARYGIRSIPTLLLFKGGQVIATQVGALSKAQLAQFVEQSLG